MDYLLLIVGFACLVKGADWFVDGSCSIARILKVPSVIIGLTIVAMGTSAPETSVSISAALVGNNDIAISNVIGSNIFNALGVVGLCALLAPFMTDLGILKRDLPINFVVSVILTIMIANGVLSRLEGAILLILFVAYIAWMVREALRNRTDGEDIKVMSPLKSVIFVLLGLAVVILGGNLVVTHASNIAVSLGLSQNFIGLTIVAIGTSLPELVTSVVAVFKKLPGLALGNAIGSNIFNILFILGASSLLSPLHVLSESFIDGIVMIGVAVIMYLFARSKKSFSRLEGIICVLCYVAYTAYLFIR